MQVFSCFFLIFSQYNVLQPYNFIKIHFYTLRFIDFKIHFKYLLYLCIKFFNQKN